MTPRLYCAASRPCAAASRCSSRFGALTCCTELMQLVFTPAERELAVSAALPCALVRRLQHSRTYFITLPAAVEVAVSQHPLAVVAAQAHAHLRQLKRWEQHRHHVRLQRIYGSPARCVTDIGDGTRQNGIKAEKSVNLTTPPQVPDLASAATAAGAGARAAATSAAAA